MSTPIKKPERKGIVGITTGFGPAGDQPNPLVTVGKQLYEDGAEILGDIKDDPVEAAPRLGESINWYLRRYFRPKVKFPGPGKSTEP